jgi:hypothetical protein
MFNHTVAESVGEPLAADFQMTHLVEAPRHADATAADMAATSPPRPQTGGP